MLRRLILKLHLYVAMTAGALILMLGITGSIMAFEPEIERLEHWDYYHINSSGQKLSLADLTGIVGAAFPADHITAFTVSDSPGDVWQVWMEKNGRVYINPYSGQIVGIRSDNPDFLDYVHQLHLRLLWRQKGDPGGVIVSCSALALLFLSLSGLYLWWPVKRFTVTRGVSSRRWWFDLHNAVGIFSLVFLLIFSVSGVLLGFEGISVPMFYRITGSSPVHPPKPAAFPTKTPHIPADQALAIARAALPGALPFMIENPEPDEAYVVRMRFPEDRTPGGRSRVLVDQYSAGVLFVENSRTAPGGRRLTTLNRAIHTGDLFGLPSKVIMSLASLLVVLQTFSGLALWWKRSLTARSQSSNAVAAATRV